MLINIPDSKIVQLHKALKEIERHNSGTNKYWSAVSDYEEIASEIMDIIIKA